MSAEYKKNRRPLTEEELMYVQQCKRVIPSMLTTLFVLLPERPPCAKTVHEELPVCWEGSDGYMYAFTTLKEVLPADVFLRILQLTCEGMRGQFKK